MTECVNWKVFNVMKKLLCWEMYQKQMNQMAKNMMVARKVRKTNISCAFNEQYHFGNMIFQNPDLAYFPII